MEPLGIDLETQNRVLSPAIPEAWLGLRIGQGLDIHRLGGEGKPLIIGGITIPSERGLIAHSDGDVLRHALIDALLGSVGLGDIGEWFPPSNPQYANASSQELLEKTLFHIRQQWPQFKVMQIDATIVLQTPPLKDFKEEIRAQVALDCNLPKDRVGVKAKTAEHLGALGAGEAVMATVSLLAWTAPT